MRAAEECDSDAKHDALIPLIRRNVMDSVAGLPNLRSKQVTSLFHSTSRPVKWIPQGVIAAEIAVEDRRESYTHLQINGRRPASAPETADATYVRTLDKAWSTGDFEGIANCVFSELQDTDFRRGGDQSVGDRRIVRYEFAGRRPSACVGVQHRSEVVYPGFKGRLDADPRTGEVVHIELEATDIPSSFPMDRAERSVDFKTFTIGGKPHLLPATAFWFGCFRNSSSCFLNRIDFTDYRRFQAESNVRYLPASSPSPAERSPDRP